MAVTPSHRENVKRTPPRCEGRKGTPMADRLQWKLTHGGKEYIFDPKEMLTVSALREIKRKFGAELGRYMTFQGALLQQDPEAALCAIWLARKAAGETDVPDPNDMDDFSVGELFEKGFDTPKSEVDPTPGASAPTRASTETPTSSDAERSDPSGTSSATDPETSTS